MIQLPDLAPRLRAILAALLVTGVLAAGCGSDDAASSATTTGSEDSADDTTTTEATDSNDDEDTSGHGCDLFSDEVTTEVLGVAIARRDANGEPASGIVSCLKGTERVEDLADSYYVSASVFEGGGSVLFDEATSGGDSQPVDGLGDQAAYIPSAGVLFIVDGADGLSVQVVKAGVPASQQDCVKVAKDILSRRS